MTGHLGVLVLLIVGATGLLSLSLLALFAVTGRGQARTPPMPDSFGPDTEKAIRSNPFITDNRSNPNRAGRG